MKRHSLVSAVIFWSALSSSFAMADTILTPRYQVLEYRATNGASTAGSFSAASVMGAKGYSNTTPAAGWEASIIDSCRVQTAALPQANRNLISGPSLWPSACNPEGMALALNLASDLPHWIKVALPGGDGSETDPGRVTAFNAILTAFKIYQSPVVVPLYGQADHWATIVQLNLFDTAPNTGKIKSIKYYDGGPPSTNDLESLDSGQNQYPYANQLPITYSAATFGNTYYKVLNAINAGCDPNCSADPYFHQYVLLYEPPLGLAPMSLTASTAASPGLVDGVQQRMTPQLAQARVFEALANAGIDRDQATWAPIRGRLAGSAHEVRAYFPSGAPWNYYLIPLFSNPNMVHGFVQLSASDGSFESVHPLSTAVAFTPVSQDRARELASDLLLDGEVLGAGTLTWDARTITTFGKSPIHPYYEYVVSRASHPAKGIGAIRVALDGGLTARTER